MNRWRGRGHRFVTEDIGGMVVWKGFSGAANWWDPNNEGLCIWAAYAPKGAADFAASLVDLSGSGNNAVDPGGASTPPWDAVNGWKFDGVADYLTTTFAPSNDQTQTMIVQFTNWTVTPLHVFCGLQRSGVNHFRIMQHSTTNTIYYSNGGTSGIAPTLVAGNLAVAGNQGYRNGAADGGLLGAWGLANIFTVYIGCMNNSGVASNFAAYYCTAFAIYDCTLTAPQVLAVATAMAAL